MQLRNPAEKAAKGAVLGTRIGLFFGLLFAFFASGCVTVRPEQRAVLADPTMQFDAEPGDGAAREHVLENREGSSGGGSVKGGGCGCN